MKKVIQFTKVRLIMLAFSVLIVVAGYVTMALRGGFNVGIDFTGGLNKQFQIAPVAMFLEYRGEGRATVDVRPGYLSLDLSVEESGGPLILDFDQYGTIGELAAALDGVKGMDVQRVEGLESDATDGVLALGFVVDLSGGPLPINIMPTPDTAPAASIENVRDVLAPLGAISIQVIGNSQNQEYLLKVPVFEEEDSEFLQRMDANVTSLLANGFGADTVIAKKIEFVGAVFSIELIRGALSSIAVALILILIYITIRFRFVFAIAAITALVHDVAIMIGVIGGAQLEVSGTTVAAILTIIGYSLNDTIVVFDRVRENTGLMPDSGREVIINTSITQSLSRTTITSITTLLAVVAIYIFGTGAIKDFAFNLIIGVVVGTYSSIFIAAQIVLGWQQLGDRRGRREKRQEGIAKPGEKKEDTSGGVESESSPQTQVPPETGNEPQNMPFVPQTRRPPKKKKKKKRR